MAGRGLANLYIHMTPKGMWHPGGMQIYQCTWYVTFSKALGATHPSGVVHIYKSNSSLVCYNVCINVWDAKDTPPLHTMWYRLLWFLKCQQSFTQF